MLVTAAISAFSTFQWPAFLAATTLPGPKERAGRARARGQARGGAEGGAGPSQRDGADRRSHLAADLTSPGGGAVRYRRPGRRSAGRLCHVSLRGRHAIGRTHPKAGDQRGREGWARLAVDGGNLRVEVHRSPLRSAGPINGLRGI